MVQLEIAARHLAYTWRYSAASGPFDVKGMSSVMEPLIIVVIGLMVALVVTAVMEPILKLSEVADVI